MCAACSAGKIGATGGSTCSECAPGTFSLEGKDACLSCPPGSFNELSGSGTCSDCPGDLFSEAGSVKCILCLRTFYFSIEGVCVPCPDGVLCDTDGSSTQVLMNLAAGYWRISGASTDVNKCPFSDGCAGGNNFDGRRLAANVQYGDGYCSEGYMGPLCAVCRPNGYYFDPDAKICTSCEKSSGLSPTMIVFSVVFLIAVFGGVMMYLSRGDKIKERAAETKQAIVSMKKRSDAMVNSVKSLFGDAFDAVKTNSDGSITLSGFKTKAVPQASEEKTVKICTPLADITATTTITTESAVRVATKVVVKPSNKIMSGLASVRQAQQKIKALTSFGQIRYATFAVSCSHSAIFQKKEANESSFSFFQRQRVFQLCNHVSCCVHATGGLH